MISFGDGSATGSGETSRHAIERYRIDLHMRRLVMARFVLPDTSFRIPVFAVGFEVTDAGAALILGKPAVRQRVAHRVNAVLEGMHRTQRWPDACAINSSTRVLPEPHSLNSGVVRHDVRAVGPTETLAILLQHVDVVWESFA